MKIFLIFKYNLIDDNDNCLVYFYLTDSPLQNKAESEAADGTERTRCRTDRILSISISRICVESRQRREKVKIDRETTSLALRLLLNEHCKILTFRNHICAILQQWKQRGFII